MDRSRPALAAFYRRAYGFAASLNAFSTWLAAFKAGQTDADYDPAGWQPADPDPAPALAGGPVPADPDQSELPTGGDRGTSSQLPHSSPSVPAAHPADSGQPDE